MEDDRAPDQPEERDADLVQEDNGCVWIPDDFPLYGPASNEPSGADREFVDYLMESNSASSELLTVGDINAPVNSEKALSEVYPLSKRIAYPVTKLDRSVCVGTWRLTFSVEYGKKGPTKLNLLYRMHHVSADPGVDPSVIVFYGPSGHEGKTTLAMNLTMLLAGAVVVLICDEREIGDGFSYQHIKRWTSNAPVSSGGRTGFLLQTLIVVSDKIPFYNKAAVSNSIGRRLVIYDIRKDLGSEKPVDRSEIANSAILKFLSSCLAPRNASRSTPTSPAIAIYTMFRKSINSITAGIGYDSTSSREQSSVATTMIAVRCRVRPKTLRNPMKAIASEMIMAPTHGTPYIRHLKPLTKMTLTTHGMEVVMANRGKATLRRQRAEDAPEALERQPTASNTITMTDHMDKYKDWVVFCVECRIAPVLVRLSDEVVESRISILRLT
ncbi:hypothetical protein DL771_007756 [Monosporascus sp. 5C6A]|nr:hypothetical protein DL771_007756 [Monosporascus sp. 5C6A]